MASNKIAIAMSGGIDSSIAAFLLKKAGYDVFGIHLELQTEPADLTKLEYICKKLVIPLYRLDFTKKFQELVIRDFYHEYASGRTPNPCIVCNNRIKFGFLLKQALQMGASHLATGHYARIDRLPNGFRLLKGIDSTKDQSYFLYTLKQRQLQRLLLPLGNYYKEEVRKLATELHLTFLTQNESQDICFIPDNDYRSFITKYIKPKPGIITDITGKVLGKHDGLALFTIGQRQGLGISAGGPYYVIHLDTSQNIIIVGPYEALLKKKVYVRKLNWVSGNAPAYLRKLTAKIRYRSPETTATYYQNDEFSIVNFNQPQRAIAPGQSVVFYEGDVILGGGVIEATKN
jgi:tRNA-specific 2-thiouridylase